MKIKIEKKWTLPFILIFIIGLVFTYIILSIYSDNGNITYRETSVSYGELVVGITESGSVDIGTIEQVFELEMSELESVSTSNTGGSNQSGSMGSNMGNSMGGNMGSTGGGLDMFSQMFQMANGQGTSATTDNSPLVIEEVYITVGAQVEAGDALYLLEESGVMELTNELESNVSKASADLEALMGDQLISESSAKYTYQTSLAYGTYMYTEYDNTIETLAETVIDKTKSLSKAETNLAEYTEQLELANVEYTSAMEVLNGAKWSRDNVDKKNNLALYITYFQQAETVQNIVDTLEQKIEQLEENIEQAESNLTTCQTELARAKRDLAYGLTTAKQTRDLRALAFDTAEESYNIVLAYLEEDLEKQNTIYEEASEEWEEFAEHISGNTVQSKYNGIITEVSLKVGDTLSTNDVVVSLYNLDDVTMTVTVDEKDMTDIILHGKANIELVAYPDTVVTSTVTDISDATTDAKGNVTYEVTVTLKGDVSGLFQGMTGKVTFITKETEEVVYVSNRAITREGTTSYVKMYDAQGRVVKQEVVTGFSDGVNVEILEGLLVGDVVLIESKVSE